MNTPAQDRIKEYRANITTIQHEMKIKQQSCPKQIPQLEDILIEKTQVLYLMESKNLEYNEAKDLVRKIQRHLIPPNVLLGIIR